MIRELCGAPLTYCLADDVLLGCVVRYDDFSLWWKHEVLARWVCADYPSRHAFIAPQLQQLQAMFFERTQAVLKAGVVGVPLHPSFFSSRRFGA
jgi:hypothetical protein